MPKHIFTKEDYFKILDGSPTPLTKLGQFAQRSKGIKKPQLPRK